MKLRVVQAAVAVMALLGLASLVVIGFAVVDLYQRQQDTNAHLCVLAQQQWELGAVLAHHLRVPLTVARPTCPPP